MAHLKKYGIFGKMEHICKNAAHSENCGGALGNMSHIWENAVHLQKCGAFGKNVAHLVKCSTFGKMIPLFSINHTPSIVGVFAMTYA